MLASTFNEALAGARAGAERAWTQISDDLAPIVLGYLTARGASDAEDLTGARHL